MSKELIGPMVVMAVAAAISLVFYLPIKWLLTKARAGELLLGDVGNFVVTRTGLVFYSALVFVLLFGFAQIYLNPTTWFGRQMATWQGCAVWCVSLVACEWVFTRVFARMGYPFLRPPNRHFDNAKRH